MTGDSPPCKQNIELSANQNEHFSTDHCSQRKVVKTICEILPYVGVSVLSEALVEESIHLGDLSALVISSQNCDPVGISHWK